MILVRTPTVWVRQDLSVFVLGKKVAVLWICKTRCTSPARKARQVGGVEGGGEEVRPIRATSWWCESWLWQICFSLSFYSCPSASNVFLQNVCPQHFVSLMGHKMFLLTLVKYVPFQLFPLLQNVLFDQASFVSFHLLSYGGGGIFQMFFFNSGRLYLLTSACGERGNFKCSF